MLFDKLPFVGSISFVTDEKLIPAERAKCGLGTLQGVGQYLSKAVTIDGLSRH